MKKSAVKLRLEAYIPDYPSHLWLILTAGVCFNAPWVGHKNVPPPVELLPDSHWGTRWACACMPASAPERKTPEACVAVMNDGIQYHKEKPYAQSNNAWIYFTRDKNKTEKLARCPASVIMCCTLQLGFWCDKLATTTKQHQEYGKTIGQMLCYL